MLQSLLAKRAYLTAFEFVLGCLSALYLMFLLHSFTMSNISKDASLN